MWPRFVPSRCRAGPADFLRHLCVRRNVPPSFPCSSKFVYSPEVRDALKDGRPLVALESTIIAHGMPASALLHVFLCFLERC